MWKDQRKFLHDKLRLFGMTYLGNGKHIMEGRIMVCLTNEPILLLLVCRIITKNNLLTAGSKRFVDESHQISGSTGGPKSNIFGSC